jgi:hypothetical protein
MRQRHAPTFSSCFPHLAADLQAAIAPMLADPHFPALLNADQVARCKARQGWTKTRWPLRCCRWRRPARAPTFPI